LFYTDVAGNVTKTVIMFLQVKAVTPTL